MVCYYHPARPAVGICKHCQRGLCVECAAPVADSLACKDRHEDQVRAVDELIQRNILQSKRVSSVYNRNALFYFLSGAVFTAFGIYQIRWLGLEGIVFLLLGLFLLYAAAANYFEGKKYT